MDKADLRLAKKKILKCLTEDIEYGINKRTGEPLKRRKISQALFDKKCGYAIWSETDLEMVMDKVVLGLYFALQDSLQTLRTKDAPTPPPVRPAR